MSWTIALCSISSRDSPPAFLPSLKTVTRWARRFTSARRCEMKMMPTPLAERRSTTSYNFCVSESESDAVGSSIMITRALVEMALAISTICCLPVESSETGVVVGRSRPISSSATLAAWCIALRSIRPMRVGSRPRKMFCAISRLSARFSSWWISEMPSDIACCTPESAVALPSIRISPVSGMTSPARLFISVLLPAPFSPMIARTSPSDRRIETLSSAITPG